MTREEQVAFCERCLNREMDLKQGLICSLSGEKATFQNKCMDFKFDETTNEKPKFQKRMQIEMSNLRVSPEIFEKLKMEQRLMAGIISGLIVGLSGAILWGWITVSTGYQWAFMALVIGAGVGFSIRIFGNGIEPIFGIYGAVISFLSVLFGNFLSIIGFVANSEGLGFIETIRLFDYSYLFPIMKETFSVIGICFYALAVFEGYKFTFRKITENKILELKEGKKANYI
jgi:hypothetical protein